MQRRRVTGPLDQHPWFVTGSAPARANHRFVDVDVFVDLPWEATARYEHSKLYFAAGPEFEFDEERVSCIHITTLGQWHTVRVALPPTLRTDRMIRLRFDPAPGMSVGTGGLGAARLVTGTRRPELTRAAERSALKEHTRRQGDRAERQALAVVDALPHTLSIEITARCNITCTHCSSHGTPELHRRHNAMREMSVDTFERLADETFPAATTVGLVGRGEPTLVSDKLWQALCRKLDEHDARLTMVTNGTLLHRRLDARLVSRIETLHVSIDGDTEETFAANRGGASLATVMAGLRHFVTIRDELRLARRPRLGIHWTLKTNNVAELPTFVERIKDLGVDQLTVRHLLVYHPHNRDESVVERPDLVNPALRRTYELLERYGIRSDCPPLIDEQVLKPSGPVETAVTVGRGGARRRDGCMFVYRTGVIHADGLVPTCSVPFAATAGNIEDTSFGAIWDGDVLRTVRSTLDTADEWEQCTHCWYREGRYKSQREAFDSGADRYDITMPDRLTRRTWDFETYTQ
jgi:radical SAM protein with 4Fe4S-binding SPASM domain